MHATLQREPVWYVNLTQGLAWLPAPDVHVCRIQSTHLEQHRWDDVLASVPDEMLLFLALGRRVVIVDGSTSGRGSRVIWQGIPFIRYALERRWFGHEVSARVRGQNVLRYFRQAYAGLSARTKRRLAYYRQYAITDAVRMEGWSVRLTMEIADARVQVAALWAWRAQKEKDRRNCPPEKENFR
ncbi:MAG: hypothetical protein DRP85_09495 [Candidatus Makaraimicrobium thalassicum]|nr:MAG: hypothetical protein DRP85_09495 [Candidatus Omnitrophota bacterium]